MDVDHYEVLGLPSGVEGAKLIEKEISKAYKFKALELHPDKRPDDPNARANFQKLKSSYDILKDEKARKLFDDLLKIKHEKQQRQSQHDSKKRKMMSDLEERERAVFAPEPAVKAQQEEKRIARQLKEEIERIRAMHVKKEAAASFALHRETKQSGGGGAGAGLDKEKMLKVSWEKVDVVIKSSKKKGSALIVMANKDAVVAATGSVCGSLSNLLLVLPFQPAVAAEFPCAQRSAETNHINNLVGPAYHLYEDFVLQKIQMDVRAHRVLRVLLSHMAYADDDESLDDAECSAAALDVLSNVFADEILPTLMPINQKRVNGRLYSELRITRGWPKFAKSRGIEEGDEVRFHRLDDDVGVVYICEVVKKSASSSSNAGLEGMNHNVGMYIDHDQVGVPQVNAGMNNNDQIVHNPPMFQADAGMDDLMTQMQMLQDYHDAGMSDWNPSYCQYCFQPYLLYCSCGLQ
ncbi:hypothetical protein JRO89_XS02G0209100 [Xanthoceras sorbifolium]|uniref:J domain-containing protein n=1 Tax=Xanthoceras sorbifolium TaxID=99658 RepID=A0ABQ8IGX5_9ROSI|nr:hypothetical protein JRO89_XS02G0209100 [Xanthoceras sorbifolium]